LDIIPKAISFKRTFSREEDETLPVPHEKALVKEKKRKKKAYEIQNHILKQKALRFFSDTNVTIKEVAETLKVTVDRIKSFFDDQEFVKELNERIDKISGINSEFRLSQSKFSLYHLYEELRRRQAEGELKDVPARDLHRMIVDTQKELRLDTPGDVTSKIGVADLVELQDRYNKSLSGKVAKRTNVLELPAKKEAK
jgi:plasmid maintenance system antidote protein VapI